MLAAFSRSTFVPLALALSLSLSLAFFASPGSSRAQSYDAGLQAYESEDYDRAFEIWRPLAEGGDPVAQYSLGKLFERGGGAIAQDFVQAARWYRVAARQGIAAAQNNLALMHAQGRGVELDVDRAVELWMSAARQDHPMAQYNLGLAYFRGEGVERDEREAAAWFRRAADAGLPDAQYAMGQMNRLGLILPKDQAQALGWYVKAADQGHREAKSQGQLLEAAGVVASDPGPPEIVPKGLAAADGTGGQDGAADAMSQGPQALQAAGAAQAQPQADQGTMAAKGGSEAPETAKQAEPATAQSMAASTAAALGAEPAEGAQTQMAAAGASETGAAEPAGEDASVTPKRKPAVPQLAMQPVAPSPYPDEALAEGTSGTATQAEAEALAQVQPAAGAEEPSLPAPSAPTPEQQAAAEPAMPEVPTLDRTAKDEAAGTAAVQQTVAAQQTQIAAAPAAAAGESEEKAENMEKQESMTQPTQPAGASNVIQVWVASEQNPDAALKLWPKTKAKYPELMARAQPEIARVDLGEGAVFYRLMIGPLKSWDAARDLCALMRLQDEDAFCKVLNN